MARKASPNNESAHGFNDIIGVVLMCFAALLLAALLSYHPKDVSANAVPPNASVHNWIGPFGAWLAYYWFFWTGAVAYLFPFLLFFVGLGCFLNTFAYLRRRWAWALVLVLCCMGLLDLYRDYFDKLHRSLNTNVGGIIGRNLNQHFFGECFGTAGATIVFLMLYFISLLFLTNFQLGDWIRGFWGRRAAARAEATADEVALDEKARDLKKQEKRLREEVERSGLGADLKPVPKPKVVDLSVPQPDKPDKAGRAKKPAPPESVEPEPAEEGEVIPAREVAAASTADILGKSAEAAAKAAGAGPAEAEAEVKQNEDGKPFPPKRDPEVVINGVTVGAKTRPPRKVKPLTVASTPMIGN